ncbi:MAG: RNA methyltransferase [Candidatus Undinarchaeales archaeon]|jgi:TrmH family RNA methyltransferase|nr:RNA methyltransferase [Candidatus Undinarchaeales archaeon]MDP7494317.1 RNA methyltransferase [Candidatus Undinarchaeales archaeon]
MTHQRPPKVREDILPESSSAAPAYIDNLEVVLVRPRESGNVGSCARALGNFGARHLTVVGMDWFDRSKAEKRAVGASWLLDRVRFVDTLDEAIADCTFVYGTAGRAHRHRRTITARSFTDDATGQLVSNRVALLFGCERTGLTETETDACHAVVAIPTDPAFHSLNLSHAVVVMLYELWCGSVTTDRDKVPKYVPAADQNRLMDLGRRTLYRIGFLRPENEPRILRTLMNLSGRTGLTRREFQTLEGVLHRMYRIADEQGTIGRDPDTSAAQGKVEKDRREKQD